MIWCLDHLVVGKSIALSNYCYHSHIFTYYVNIMLSSIAFRLFFKINFSLFWTEILLVQEVLLCFFSFTLKNTYKMLNFTTNLVIFFFTILYYYYGMKNEGKQYFHKILFGPSSHSQMKRRFQFWIFYDKGCGIQCIDRLQKKRKLLHLRFNLNPFRLW